MYKSNPRADTTGWHWSQCLTAFALLWYNIQGWIPLHEMCKADTHEKIDEKKANRHLLRHGQHKSFRVQGRAWTFSGSDKQRLYGCAVGWPSRPGRHYKRNFKDATAEGPVFSKLPKQCSKKAVRPQKYLRFCIIYIYIYTQKETENH